MARIVDNMVAYKILRMLVKPFAETDAYRLGIIDAKGKNLRKANTLKTSEELDSYTYLHRLVFNVKKILNRLPGGENRMKSLIAALWLVKECYENGNQSSALMQEKFDNMIKMLDNRVSLVEEEILVKKFLGEDGMAVGGAPTNNTSGAAVTEPKIQPKNIKKYQSMARRKPVNVSA
jgi:hypothetical protein